MNGIGVIALYICWQVKMEYVIVKLNARKRGIFGIGDRLGSRMLLLDSCTWIDDSAPCFNVELKLHHSVFKRSVTRAIIETGTEV